MASEGSSIIEELDAARHALPTILDDLNGLSRAPTTENGRNETPHNAPSTTTPNPVEMTDQPHQSVVKFVLGLVLDIEQSVFTLFTIYIDVILLRVPHAAGEAVEPVPPRSQLTNPPPGLTVDVPPHPSTMINGLNNIIGDNPFRNMFLWRIIFVPDTARMSFNGQTYPLHLSQGAFYPETVRSVNFTTSKPFTQVVDASWAMGSAEDRHA
ncbi:hypothetical protein DFS33DRAFT_1322100 [Desarmillaria ectypa]|nr:hypothetical protein DFS33DRAFT_1322100 [Desarmillaria ectypa]